MRAEMEKRFNAKVVTYEDRKEILPGGMCGRCGSGPDADPDWQAEPRYIYRAGICDPDGVYYSQLCEDCLEETRFESTKRPQTERDETAEDITELLGDDIDGAQTFMDDLQ